MAATFRAHIVDNGIVVFYLQFQFLLHAMQAKVEHVDELRVVDGTI